MRKRLRFTCLVAPLAALLCLALAGPAAAGKNHEGTQFEAGDPLTTNIPYVAWAGEEVRLVKCVDISRIEADVEWDNVEWSTNREPSFFDDIDQRTESFAGRGDQSGRTCGAIDIVSHSPGMAVVKMSSDALDPPEGAPELKHQFLVIWLGMNAPVLEELDANDFPGLDVGDPLGDGNFLAGADNGYVRATITGSFDGIRGDEYTLPRDWAALATRYAHSSDSISDPMAWDIHDDQAETEGHTSTSMCGGIALIDAVDNCLGGGEAGRFSRTVGGTSFTLGPFDPVRPGSSYLPDGKLDAGDAPMPAARINLAIDGVDLDPGPAVDATEFGAFVEADKHVIYSRDRAGGLDNPLTPTVDESRHQLYAPFYAALIPPSSFLLEAIPLFGTTSGVLGAIPNNFPGFQVGPFENLLGVYHYWDLINATDSRLPNECRDVGGTGQVSDGQPLQRATGPDAGIVYTDEHGEAIVAFDPNVGVNLTADEQGLCDLGEISATPELLARSTISATAEDPFQPTFNGRIASNVLTKSLFELAGKSLDCFPKNSVEVLCVETIRDIFGDPVVGAKVLFSAQADAEPNIIGATGPIFDFDGSTCNSRPDGTVACWTNADGQAGIVIKSTIAQLVDVDAENYNTRVDAFGIQRLRCVRFFGLGTTLPTDGASCQNPTDAGGTDTNPTPPNPVVPNTPSSSNGVASAQSAAVVVSLAGTSPVAAKAPEAKAKAKAKAATARLASAKLVVIKGKRYLVLRAKGTAKTMKVRIVLVMRTGKVMKPVVRTIRTNRAVRVSKLQISKHVRTVRVTRAR